MKGSDYVAVVALYGRPPAFPVLAAPGETCERVPAGSLEQLLANGDIRPKPPARARGRRKEEE